MNPSESDKMTPFDRLISPRQLQLLKLFIPYIPVKSQRILAVYTKFTELTYTLQFFQRFQKDIHAQTCQKPISSPFDVLDEIRPYLSEEEQNKVDSFANLLNMMELISSLQNISDSGSEDSDMGSINPMDMMKGMLSPEQQEMFEMYSSMFRDNAQDIDSGELGEKGDSIYE